MRTQLLAAAFINQGEVVRSCPPPHHLTTVRAGFVILPALCRGFVIPDPKGLMTSLHYTRPGGGCQIHITGGGRISTAYPKKCDLFVPMDVL